MRFYEMEEGKVYNIAEGNCLYRIEGGNVECYKKSVEEWDKTNVSHKALYETDFKEIRKNGWEEAKHNEEYYCIEYGFLVEVYRNNSNFDEKNFKSCNMFSTKEKAEQIRDMNLLQRMMQKFADENNEGEIDWGNDNESKFRVGFDCLNEKYEPLANWESRSVNEVYFTSKEIAQRCIDEIIEPFYNKEPKNKLDMNQIFS